MARDFYEILGVNRSATADEIRNAHKKLVRKYHPDAGKKSPDSVKRFQEVQEAFDVLSDDSKRKQYDQFGHAGAAQAPPGYQSGYGGGVRPEDFDPGYGGGGGSPGGGPGGGFGGGQQVDPGQFGDMFEQLFGSRGAFGRGKRSAGQQPAEPAGSGDVEYPFTLSFEQAARGANLPLSINRGSSKEQIEVKIPAGVKTGSRVRVQGRGSQMRSGRGDLFIIVNVADHPYFKRDNLDVIVEVPVSIYEAVLGANVSVPTLDGEVTMTIPPGTSSGTRLRLRGKGINRALDSGDQYVIVKVVVPKDLDPTEIGIIQQLQNRKPINARADVLWK